MKQNNIKIMDDEAIDLPDIMTKQEKECLKEKIHKHMEEEMKKNTRKKMHIAWKTAAAIALTITAVPTCIYAYEEISGYFKSTVEKEGYQIDLTGDEYYTAVGEGEDAVKVYDWHKALRTLAENYYKERLIVHYIIAAEGLADGYDATYDAICEKYSESYRISYAKNQDIDLDNMTEKEAKQVRDAVNNYLASNVGYDYLTERAHYQLVLDYFTEGAGKDYVVEN